MCVKRIFINLFMKSIGRVVGFIKDHQRNKLGRLWFHVVSMPLRLSFFWLYFILLFSAKEFTSINNIICVFILLVLLVVAVYLFKSRHLVKSKV